MTTPENIPELSLAVTEGIEAEFMYQLVDGTPEPARTELGISTTRIGGGVVLSVRNDPSSYWSKALGFTEPITPELIAEVVDFYRGDGAPLGVLQIAPSALPADWDEIAARHGLRAGNQIHKHAARIDSLQFGSSDLRVDEVTPEQAEEWATVMLTGFGMPLEGLTEMVMATVTNPVFRGFAAWDGDRIVATGNLLIQDGVGCLHAGATAADHRGRGAQSALIAARAKAAADAGCEWVVSETGTSGSSLNNMLRTGLRTLYTRPNWIWEA